MTIATESPERAIPTRAEIEAIHCALMDAVAPFAANDAAWFESSGGEDAAAWLKSRGGENALALLAANMLIGSAARCMIRRRFSQAAWTAATTSIWNAAVSLEASGRKEN